MLFWNVNALTSCGLDTANRPCLVISLLLTQLCLYCRKGKHALTDAVRDLDFSRGHANNAVMMQPPCDLHRLTADESSFMVMFFNTLACICTHVVIVMLARLSAGDSCCM